MSVQDVIKKSFLQGFQTVNLTICNVAFGVSRNSWNISIYDLSDYNGKYILFKKF